MTTGRASFGADPAHRTSGDAARRLGLPAVPAWTLITAMLLSALVCGRLLADGHMKYGVAIVLAVCYGPLVFFNLSRAFAIFVAILFFHDISLFSAAPNAVGVLVGLGWLGTFLGSGRVRVFARQHRRLLLTIAGFVLWITLTIAWAAQPGAAGTEAGYWWLAALAFLIVLTTITNPREVGMIAVAFVVGSVISVIIGLATGSLEASSTANTQTAIQGRLTGGGGDPNEQAAAFVAAMFLIVGLFSLYRRRLARVSLVASFALLAVGFFATQSRGGLLALGGATLAALVLAPRQRSRILGLLVLAGVAAVTLLATTPGALSRITNLGGGTSGRSDLWRVGWQVFTGHPLFGIGAGNFVVVESHYVLRPGTITRIQYLTVEPHLVHNTYLQLLAETGIVGLVGFLAVIIASLRAAAQAARRFDAAGQPGHADLTRAVMMGTIGMLTALFFITDGDDLRLWVLLALGPVLLGIARRATPAVSGAGRVDQRRRRRARAERL